MKASKLQRPKQKLCVEHAHHVIVTLHYCWQNGRWSKTNDIWRRFGCDCGCIGRILYNYAVNNNYALMLGNKMKLITLFTASYNGCRVIYCLVLINNAITIYNFTENLNLVFLQERKIWSCYVHIESCCSTVTSYNKLFN